jgi:hypothetical protein
MTSFSTALRNARATAIVTEVGANGKLSVYTAGYATLLYTSDCAAVLGTVAGGVLTFNPVADATGLANGNAEIARLFQSDGTTMVIEGLSVGTSGTAIVITNPAITIGQTIPTTSGVITEGNA